MRLALLKGNRFNPWHLQAFGRLPDAEVTGFRADSEIQRRFDSRDDGSLAFDIEQIYFDTQRGPIWKKFAHVMGERYLGRTPRVVPFYERLQGFDAIQSWELFTDWTAEALKAKAAYGMPVSLMVWDNIAFNMERNAQRREMKARAAHTADRFIVHTERSRRVLDMEGVPEDRIVHLDPGVDTKLFSPGEGARSGFGVSDDEFVILFVGWLVPRKGLDFLVLALRELTRDPALAGLTFRLMVVGADPGRPRIEALLERTGLRERCAFVGTFPYDRMPQAFRAADVFVLPSIAMPEWQEQFGMSLIEAMACGVPVVTTHSGSIPEVAGDAAVLCQPNDFVALYEAIKALALEPSLRADLGAAGRARAVERFSMERYVEGLSEVYASLAA